MATKVKCECGLYLNKDNMNKHLTSKTHRNVIERNVESWTTIMQWKIPIIVVRSV